MLCLRKSRDPHRRLAVWLVGLSFHHMLLMAKTQTDWPPLNKSYCRRLLLSRPQSDHEGGFVVLGWFLVWLGCVLSLLLAHFFEQAHLASPSLIHYGDLCLSAHIAPLPVQKKTRAIADMVFPSFPPAGMPIGCFHSLGIQLVSLPKGTNFIGHEAFAFFCTSGRY